MIELTGENIGEFVKQPGVAVVKFGTSWCPPCKVLGPMLEEMERDGGFRLGSVDAELNQDLSAANGIRSVPTTQFYKDGRLVATMLGMQSKAVVEEYVRKASEEQ